MSYMFWTIISSVNKVLLPKFFLKQNLEKLSNLEKAIVGWKIFVTYKYLDAAKMNGNSVIKEVS